MSDEKHVCADHCELVVRLAEWRVKTDEQMRENQEQIRKMGEKIDDFVIGSVKLKNAIWVLAGFLLLQDQGSKFMQIILQMMK